MPPIPTLLRGDGESTSNGRIKVGAQASLMVLFPLRTPNHSDALITH